MTSELGREGAVAPQEIDTARRLTRVNVRYETRAILTQRDSGVFGADNANASRFHILSAFSRADAQEYAVDNIWSGQYPKGIPAEINVDEYASLKEILERSCRKCAERSAYDNISV